MSEHKSRIAFAHLEVKDINTDTHTFTGLASTWDLDLGGDVIRKGAFKRTLRNWKSAKRNVPLVDSHNVYGSVTGVVGQMDNAQETDTGLLGEFSMIPNDTKAEEVFKRIAGGYADGLSIGYRPVKIEYPKTEEERRQGIYRYLDEVKLREVSVVLYPMNPNARIDLSTAKSLLEAAKERDLEEDEVQELKAFHDQIEDLLGDLNGKTGAEGEPTTPPLALVDPAKAEDLVSKINDLFATGLDTRISAVRHSARSVLTDL